MRLSRVIAGLVLLGFVLCGASAYEKCPNCGLGDGEDPCHCGETVVKAAKLQKPGYLASPEAINYALKYNQVGHYGVYGPAIPGYGAPVVPYAAPASFYGAPAYSPVYGASAPAYGATKLHLTNDLDPESRYGIGDGGKTYEELQHLLYRKPGTPVAPLFKPVGDLCHSDGKGKHYGSTYGNAKGTHKIVGVTPAYPGKTPCKCQPPTPSKVYGPPRTYAPSSPYGMLSHHYTHYAPAAHPVSKPVYGPPPPAYPAPKPYGPPPPPASYMAPKPYAPPAAPAYPAPKPVYGPPPAAYPAPAYSVHKPVYGPPPAAYPAPAYSVHKPVYGPPAPAYPAPKPYGPTPAPYASPKPYVPPVAYPTPKPYAPAHPAPAAYAPAKPAYSPAPVAKPAAYPAPPTVYSSTKTAYPSAAPAYATAAPTYSAKPAYSTASHYGHDDDDNEALSFAEQEQLYKAQPTIPADPVSISLAYKNFLQTPSAKKYVPEDRLAYGHRRQPADGSIHKEIANVPEEKLLTVDKPIVELKSPAKCSSSSYGGYTNRYADDDGYGELEALERETEEASERARGAYVSYSDLGYGPVSPVKNKFVTKTANVPSYATPAAYAVPAAAAYPVPSVHLPCGPLGPTVPGYKAGTVLVEEKPAKACVEDHRDGYRYKDDSEEYGSYSSEDTGCSCKGGIVERLKPKCNKHERY